MKNNRLFWILFLLNLFNYIDRQVLYSVFPLLQTDLRLNDWQLGTLASVFMLVYMCYAPFIGYLADRTSRPKLMGFSALVWSLATLACGAAKNFSHLLLARGFIGAGEGGFTTLAQPFLAEHYPKEKHASVLALFGLALPLGSALGYALGGIIGHTWGWRLAFMALSIPGMFLAGCAWFLPDPARTQAHTPRPSWLQYMELLKNKPFLYVCSIQTVIMFMMGGFSAWMPTYLFRYLHLNIAQAGAYFGGLIICCGALGTYAGGKLAESRLKKSSRAYIQVMLLSLAGCLLPIWLGLWVTHLYTVLACFGLAIVFFFLPTGAIAAALVDTTSPAVRNMAFAINIFLIHLLGDALSPSVIGWLSHEWNLKVAMLACSAVVIPGLWFCKLAAEQKKNF
ncbi:MAG: MFS transporter [Elusimicrobiaceae bacterium]|nr:MFS transporter [Elusimicrobiaceae bacterium]